MMRPLLTVLAEGFFCANKQSLLIALLSTRNGGQHEQRISKNL